jgi:hypothetical protein
MLGFAKCPSESSIYCQGTKSERLIVGVYVDDLDITGSSNSNIRKFKEKMLGLFKMSDFGLLSYYLGIEVKQGAEGITMSQGSYASKILEKGGFEDCKSCQVPMQPKLNLKESDSPAVDATRYRNLVGSLRYLVNTRPDIAFSVGYVSRFMDDPHEEHMLIVKHILRFIAGTCEVGMFYPMKDAERVELLSYSDSDQAGDLDSRKSTPGMLFFLGRSPVHWQSAKQRL